MWKETCLLSVILTVGLGASASADMVIHWGLDESGGATAYDSVGGSDGTLIGNTAWAPAGGKFGGAALFDGTDDSVRLTAEAGPFPVSDYPFTLMGWCKTTKGSAKAVAVAVVQAPYEYYWIGLQNGRGCVTARGPSGMYEQPGGSNIANDQWHHLCGVYHGPDNRQLYVDGIEVAADSRNTDFLAGIRRVAAGALDRDPGGENIVDEMLGAVDDVAIFNEALDIDTINHYMVNGIPTMSHAASEPSPEDGDTDVQRDIVLGWVPGESAGTHDVYLGTVFEQVDAASRTSPMDVLLSRGQTETVYIPDDLLEYGRTYYWRIDGVNEAPDGAVAKGETWSFTTEPFAYPIVGVSVIASSSAPNMGPEKAVDGSGLTGDLHSKDGEQMWLSSPTGPQPTWIQFEFDRAYKLDEMWVWNSNQVVETFVGFGARNVTVEYSTDGEAWTALADVPEFARAAGMDDYAHNTVVDFGGVEAGHVKLTIESNWGMLPQYGLSEVRFHYVPVQARLPEPADASTDVSVDAALNWRPGREATSHAVSLSTDRQAVADGTAAADIVTGHSYLPASLDLGTAYYWTVDEVGDTATYPGEIWSFTTQEYAVVDDLEGYTDEEGSRIYETWIDGLTDGASGSIVGYLEAPFAEQTIVQGGRQSMPLEYDNASTPFYSEAERDFSPAQNWTVNGADTLSLWVRGNPAAYVDDGGVITMSAAGHDIWDNADDFRFAYKTLTGNGSIVVKVNSLVNTNAWAKAGVMIRQSLDADSKFVYMIVSYGSGVSMGWRPLSAGGCSSVTRLGVTAPQWVKLTRTGEALTAQYAADGKTWTDLKNADGTIATTTVAMTNPVYVGLCVTSHNAAATTTAVLSDVAVTGAVGGQWQVAAIGDDPQPANSPGELYVTVRDSGGKTATATNPTAVTSGEWIEWVIPLSDFAGVNLKAVKKLSIGVDNRADPAQGGAGMLYIDGIGFGHPVAGQ